MVVMTNLAYLLASIGDIESIGQLELDDSLILGNEVVGEEPEMELGPLVDLLSSLFKGLPISENSEIIRDWHDLSDPEPALIIAEHGSKLPSRRIVSIAQNIIIIEHFEVPLWTPLRRARIRQEGLDDNLFIVDCVVMRRPMLQVPKFYQGVIVAIESHV